MDNKDFNDPKDANRKSLIGVLRVVKVPIVLLV